MRGTTTQLQMYHNTISTISVPQRQLFEIWYTTYKAITKTSFIPFSIATGVGHYCFKALVHNAGVPPKSWKPLKTFAWRVIPINCIFLLIKHRSFYPKTPFITSFSSGTKTAQHLCQRRPLLVKLLWFVKSKKRIYNTSPKQSPSFLVLSLGWIQAAGTAFYWILGTSAFQIWLQI